jgi:hypothetical protein
MLRALIVALAGLAYFIISLPMMMPLRMMENPVVNYNLFYTPFLAIMFGFLLYQCATVEKQTKAYVYGYFAAIFAWQLFGEVASMPVDKGVITQWSGVNIKLVGGYFYLLGAVITLKILWRTKAVKNSVAVFGLVFCLIWSFELYMDNYSTAVPVELMPTIAYIVAAFGGVATIVLLFVAYKSKSKETQTVVGCVLYIALTLILLGSTRWTKPDSFYVKHEGKAVERELQELAQEKEQIEELREYMIKEGIIKEEKGEDSDGKPSDKDKS